MTHTAAMAATLAEIGEKANPLVFPAEAGDPTAYDDDAMAATLEAVSGASNRRAAPPIIGNRIIPDAHPEWSYLADRDAARPPTDEEAAVYAQRYGNPDWASVYPPAPAAYDETPPKLDVFEPFITSQPEYKACWPMVTESDIKVLLDSLLIPAWHRTHNIEPAEVAA